MQEIWKSIPYYEGIYEASNLGRIRTCEGKITYSTRHGIRHWEQRVLKPKCCHASKSKNRYDLRVELWKNKGHKTYLVARLVLATFDTRYDLYSKKTVNHKDNNSLNNNINNLEWCSLKENIRKGFETGAYKSCKKVTLINKETNEIIECRSMSTASKFLNHCNGYIYNLCKKGVKETHKYYINIH